MLELTWNPGAGPCIELHCFCVDCFFVYQVYLSILNVSPHIHRTCSSWSERPCQQPPTSCFSGLLSPEASRPEEALLQSLGHHCRASREAVCRDRVISRAARNELCSWNLSMQKHYRAWQCPWQTIAHLFPKSMLGSAGCRQGEQHSSTTCTATLSPRFSCCTGRPGASFGYARPAFA